ncbi:hemin uptake protein HemP [Methylomonas methanica]|uniref:Hemin uptake protein hemP n=1 Tax=Methylomonas methanica (strain DSM 25384 / MC09) TaxID=857087 RepID=G0A7A7_METMM|nr:hemin uptake protein HemP [Methylomonas methanica]AEF99400.1 Hemin uptake protein hemP [Methylomonas methanica MC09]
MTNPLYKPKIDTARPPANGENANDRPRISSKQLFADRNEIVIDHQGDEYRLRITSNGKLILTK